MPLPQPAWPIRFIDQAGTFRQDVSVRARDSGYAPTPAYYPTMRLVRCLECRTVGAAEFPNGFNLKDGDRLQAGKPITGLCLRCNRQTELVPVPTDERRLKLYYDFQRALDETVRRGERVGPDAIIWPLEVYERWQNGGTEARDVRGG